MPLQIKPPQFWIALRQYTPRDRKRIDRRSMGRLPKYIKAADEWDESGWRLVLHLRFSAFICG
jgi:hypothetical protein